MDRTDVVGIVRHIIASIAAGNEAEVERITSGEVLSSAEIQAAIGAYGGGPSSHHLTSRVTSYASSVRTSQRHTCGMWRQISGRKRKGAPNYPSVFGCMRIRSGLKSQTSWFPELRSDLPAS